MQQVRYRLSRARFEEDGKDYVAGVKLYQEILADRQLRPVPVTNEASGMPLQADAEAEHRIAAIVKQHPAAYESFEQASAEALDQAKAAAENPAGKLLEVARMYPNSTMAAKAMIAAADAYETAVDSHRAIRVLRDMWFKYPQSPDKARILESLAHEITWRWPVRRASAGDRGPMDDMEAAAAALARAAALPGDPRVEKPLKLRDGTSIDAGTSRSPRSDTLRKYRVAEASRALPDLHIPVPALVSRRSPPTPSRRFLGVKPGPRHHPRHQGGCLVGDRDFSRTDRVVTFGLDGSLAIFAAGQTKLLATSHAAVEDPRSCAWVGDQLLVWGGSQIGDIRSTTGESAWKIDLRELQPIEVVHMGDAAQAIADPNAVRPWAAGHTAGKYRDRAGGRVIFRPGLRQQIAQPPPPAQRPLSCPASEEIVDVRPVGDHVLLTTTTGRILSADLSNGKVAWQTRLADRPVDRLVANEDFAVVRVGDDSTVRIAAFDTATGQMRCTRSWVVQSGMVPVNLALAADGTLVYTMPDRLCIKDLYKPWPDSSDKEVQAGAAPSFQKATLPDQLLIAEGRILALADDEARSVRYVRIHSLETGQPVRLRYHSTNGEQEIDRILVAGKSEKVMMRVVGSHLYLVSAGHVYSYNLDRPAEEPGAGASNSSDMPLTGLRDMTIAKNFLSIVEAGDDDLQAPIEAPPGPGESQRPARSAPAA